VARRRSDWLEEGRTRTPERTACFRKPLAYCSGGWSARSWEGVLAYFHTDLCEESLQGSFERAV
jgi:hypothetical protein